MKGVGVPGAWPCFSARMSRADSHEPEDDACRVLGVGLGLGLGVGPEDDACRVLGVGLGLRTGVGVGLETHDTLDWSLWL